MKSEVVLGETVVVADLGGSVFDLIPFLETCVNPKIWIGCK